MLSSNESNLIKQTQMASKFVHIDDKNYGEKDSYINKTAKSHLEELKAKNEIEANKIIENARQQADIIISVASEEVLMRAKSEVEAEIRQKLESEFSELYAVKINEVANLYAEATKQVKNIHNEIETKRQDWIQMNQSVIADSIFKAVSLITNDTVFIENDVVLDNFKTALNMTESTSGVIWVKVHPDFKEYLMSKNINDERIHFVADFKLAYTDFIIEFDDQIIDSTLESKLQNLKSILDKWVKDFEFI